MDTVPFARTVAVVARLSFSARTQTFGLDTSEPWALPALRVLYAAPRVYQPLLNAWDGRYPGCKRSISRLVSEGFVTYQPGIVMDTLTSTPAEATSRPVPRYLLTESGKRFLAQVEEDSRVLSDAYPRVAAHRETSVIEFLKSFDLPDSARRHGRSLSAARLISGLPEENAKWWARRWRSEGYLRVLDTKVADVREVIPAHYRPSKELSIQLRDVLGELAASWPGLDTELRLTRRRYLKDVDPARVGVTGATDYDHDVECQQVLSYILSSPGMNPDGPFVVEPKIHLEVDFSHKPALFGPGGHVYYQPDAEYREFDNSGRVRRAMLEYERFQSRKDAWSHIERFLGWASQRTLPTESLVLRFVVDSVKRERAYVNLIEAFADYCLDHPERVVPNEVTLAVSSSARLAGAADPLADSQWFRVRLPELRAEPNQGPVFHWEDTSPYHEYFGRG